MNNIFYTECPPYSPGISDDFFSDAATVTAVTSTTVVNTVTTYITFSNTHLIRRCENIHDAVRVIRYPVVRVFGEIELAVMKGL